MIVPATSNWTLKKSTEEYKAAGRVGKNLDDAHSSFMSAMARDDVSEQEILRAKERLQRAQRIYSALSEVLDSAHSILMNLIRSIKP